jgi:putative thioredoxin
MSRPASPHVIEVDQAGFAREVIERSRERPVVVDFWAPWCGPCRQLGPVLEKLATEHGGDFVLAKVDIDEAPTLAAEYDVRAIPAVRAFQDGKPTLGFVGLLPERQLREFLGRVLPTEGDRLAREALALEAASPAEAEALYRRAVERNPDHEDSLVGLARVLLARGQPEEAADLLDRAGPGVEQAAEVERIRAVLELRKRGRQYGDEAPARHRLNEEPGNARRLFELGCILAGSGAYPEALQMLLAAGEKDPKLAASEVKDVMVEVFRAVGVRSPLADEYRDKLSRLLY